MNTATAILERSTYGSARAVLTGGVVWAALAPFWWFASHAFRLIEWLFALAPLVIVPLALELIERQEDRLTRLAGARRLLQFPAAALAALSFFLPAGATAATLCAPWLVVCVLIAWEGFSAMLRDRPRTLAAVSFLVARG